MSLLGRLHWLADGPSTDRCHSPLSYCLHLLVLWTTPTTSQRKYLEAGRLRCFSALSLTKTTRMTERLKLVRREDVRQRTASRQRRRLQVARMSPRSRWTVWRRADRPLTTPSKFRLNWTSVAVAVMCVRRLLGQHCARLCQRSQTDSVTSIKSRKAINADTLFISFSAHIPTCFYSLQPIKVDPIRQTRLRRLPNSHYCVYVYSLNDRLWSSTLNESGSRNWSHTVSFNTTGWVKVKRYSVGSYSLIVCCCYSIVHTQNKRPDSGLKAEQRHFCLRLFISQIKAPHKPVA